MVEGGEASDVSTERQTTTVLSERGHLGDRVATAVGTYLVLGVGFALTLFFVAQFAGNGSSGFTTGLLSGIGVSTGVGLALLLSPLLAVFVGIGIGRESGPRAAIDAGIATAVGFLVMFFAVLVVAASLGSGLSSAVSAGPLFGFTIGVGLTGAGASIVSRSDDLALGSTIETPSGRSFVLAIGSYLVFSLGYAVAVFLAASLAPSDGGTGLGAFGFQSETTALGLGLLLSPMVAIMVGGMLARDDSGDGIGVPAVSGVANAAGFVAMLVVMYVTVAVLAPEGLEAGQFPLGPLLGFVIGVGLTGAGAAYVTRTG